MCLWGTSPMVRLSKRSLLFGSRLKTTPRSSRKQCTFQYGFTGRIQYLKENYGQHSYSYDLCIFGSCSLATFSRKEIFSQRNGSILHSNFLHLWVYLFENFYATTSLACRCWHGSNLFHILHFAFSHQKGYQKGRGKAVNVYFPLYVVSSTIIAGKLIPFFLKKKFSLKEKQLKFYYYFVWILIGGFWAKNLAPDLYIDSMIFLGVIVFCFYFIQIIAKRKTL